MGDGLITALQERGDRLERGARVLNVLVGEVEADAYRMLCRRNGRPLVDLEAPVMVEPLLAAWLERLPPEALDAAWESVSSATGLDPSELTARLEARLPSARRAWTSEWVVDDEQRVAVWLVGLDLDGMAPSLDGGPLAPVRLVPAVARLVGPAAPAVLLNLGPGDEGNTDRWSPDAGGLCETTFQLAAALTEILPKVPVGVTAPGDVIHRYFEQAPESAAKALARDGVLAWPPREHEATPRAQPEPSPVDRPQADPSHGRQPPAHRRSPPFHDIRPDASGAPAARSHPGYEPTTMQPAARIDRPQPGPDRSDTRHPAPEPEAGEQARPVPAGSHPAPSRPPPNRPAPSRSAPSAHDASRSEPTWLGSAGQASQRGPREWTSPRAGAGSQGETAGPAPSRPSWSRSEPAEPEPAEPEPAEPEPAGAAAASGTTGPASVGAAVMRPPSIISPSGGLEPAPGAAAVGTAGGPAVAEAPAVASPATKEPAPARVGSHQGASVQPTVQPEGAPPDDAGCGQAEGLAALRAAMEADSRTRGRFVPGTSLDVRSSSRRITVDLVCQRAALVVEVVDHRVSDVHAHRRRNHRDLLLQLDGWVVLRVLATDASSDAKRVVGLIAGAMLARLGRA